MTQVKVWTDPLRDMQQIPPVGWCRRRQGELYGEESGLCPECRAQLREMEQGQEDRERTL